MQKRRIITLFILASFFITLCGGTNFHKINASGTGDWSPPVSGQWVISQETVVENEEFTLNGSVEIQSGGKLILKNCNIIMNSTSHGEVFIEVLEGANITIISSTIRAADKFAWYLETFNDSTCRIEDSTFIGVKEDAYYNELLTIDSKNSIFLRNTIYNASKAGVRIGSNALYSNVRDNYIYDVIDYGLWVSYADHSFIINNTVEYVNNWGLMVYGANNVTIRNNDVSNCNYGFWVTVCDNFTLDSNIVSDCGTYSLNLGTSTNGTIMNNEVWRPFSFAYELAKEHTFWESNFVDGKEAIMITDSSDLYIVDNIIEYPNSIGQLILLDCNNIEISQLDCNSIYIRYSSDIDIHNNFVTGGGIYTGSSIVVHIENNTITEAGSSAIMNHSSTNMTIIQNYIYDCFGIGIGLQNGDFSEIIGNMIENCSNGIYLTGGIQMLIALNKIYDTRFSGLRIEVYDSQIFSNFIYSCLHSLEITGGDNLYIFKNAFVNPESDQGSATFALNLQLYSGTTGNFWSDHTNFGPYDFDGYTDLFPIIDIDDFWHHYYENYGYLDDDPPIIALSQVSGEITSLTAVTIEVEIIDDVSLVYAVLGYSIDNQISWTNISLIPENEENYYCTIPAGLPENTIVFYQVIAEDYVGNLGASQVLNFTTTLRDLDGPLISSYHSPEILVQNKEFTITALIEDEGEITRVVLIYSIDGGENWMENNMTKDELVDIKWTVTLSIETEEDSPFMYFIEAVDESENIGKTQIKIIFLKTRSQVFFDNPLANIGFGALVSLILIGLAYGILQILLKKKIK